MPGTGRTSPNIFTSSIPDDDVVAFHYRGYAPSTGSPSAEALIADAPLVYDAAVARIRPKRVIAVGFSIGTGVAAQLSASREARRAHPRHAVRFARRRSPNRCIRGCRSGRSLNTRSTPPGRSRPATCRSRSSRPSATRSSRPSERTRSASVFQTSSSIGPSADAGHNDIYARSDFQRSDARMLSSKLGGNCRPILGHVKVTTATDKALARGRGSIHILELKRPIARRDTLTDPQS